MRRVLRNGTLIKFEAKLAWCVDRRWRECPSASRESRIQCHATVNKKGGAGHIIGGIGHQPSRSSRNVIGLADALVGHQGHQVAIGVSRGPSIGIDGFADRARSNAVDANAIGGVGSTFCLLNAGVRFSHWLSGSSGGHFSLNVCNSASWRPVQPYSAVGGRPTRQRRS